MPTPTQRFFDSVPESVRQARDFATRTLATWGLAARADDIRHCVSELATNAMEHGTVPGHGFTVTMAADDGIVRVEVHDSSNRQPHPRHPTVSDISGRGLQIIDELSDGWGVEDREPTGKVIWSQWAP